MFYYTAHFKSVAEKDMLNISLELNRIPLHNSPYYIIGQKQKIVRYIALSFCHLYCIFFNHLTRAFENTGDKLLYLYFLAHFLFIYSAYSSQFSQHHH